MGFYGPDAFVMDFHWIILCFMSVILSFCVSCNCTDEETGHLRHMWLLSMRDAKRREKAANPARGFISHQLLYCRVGIGFHLQILKNGSVWGVHEPSEYSLLRVFALRPGVVGIRGVMSELYLCMNQEGIAHGMKKFSNECLFKERMEENHYNTYSSMIHTGFFSLCPSKGSLGEATGWAATRPAHTFFLANPHHTKSNLFNPFHGWRDRVRVLLLDSAPPIMPTGGQERGSWSLWLSHSEQKST